MHIVNDLFEILAGCINRHPYRVAAVFTFLLAVALYGMTLVTMASGTDTYLDRTSEKGILMNQYTDTFQSDTIILLIETDDILDPSILAYVDELEQEVLRLPDVASTSGLVDLLKQANGGALPDSVARVEQIRQGIPASVYDRYVPSREFTLVQVKLIKGFPSDKEKQLLSDLETIIALSTPPPGVSVTVTGSTPFKQQMQAEMGMSTGVLIGVAMLLMVITMGVLFSYVRYRFLPVAVVGCGILFTFGFMGLSGMQISMAVIGSFPILIGLGIDYAIQFHARLDEEVCRSSLAEAVTTTLTRTGPAVLYAMLATALGFCAMYIAPIPMIRDFGMVCMIGVIICYLTSLVAVPLAATLLQYRPTVCGLEGTKGKMDAYDRMLTSVSVRVAKNPVPILLLAALVAIIGLQLDSTIPIDTNEDTFVPPDMPAKISLEKVTRTIGSTDSLPVYVKGDAVTSLDSVRWIREFGDHAVSRYDKITGVTSIASLVLDYNNNVMPSTQEELDAVIARIPSAVKDRYLSGKTATVIEFSTVSMEMEVKDSLKSQFITDQAFIPPPPGVSAAITGNFDLFTTLISSIIDSKEAMTLIGFALVLSFLLLIYRKIHAASPIIPIVAIVGWNAVGMVVLNVHYSPLTATLGSMTIGVGAEYTILIMERFLEEREKTEDPLHAIQESVRKIGSAITVSGMATFLGFSALMISSFPIVSNFGISTVLAVGFTLCGAIILMPAVLSIIESLIRTIHEHRSGSPSVA